MQTVCNGRHFAWAKIALLAWLFTPDQVPEGARRIFSQWLGGETERLHLITTVDYLVWIDGDALVLDHSVDLGRYVSGRFSEKVC